MRNNVGILVLATIFVLIPQLGTAHGSGGGGSGMVSAEPTGPGGRDSASKQAYNSGVRSIKKAQSYDDDAAKASTPEKSAKAHEKAQKLYQESLESFITAVADTPTMYQAWNYLGFANRHLGHYDDALSAYAKALELNPNYPDAIEYRGEAYLGLNKIEDAKAAYMSLFRGSRPLADELMTAMHHWADSRRQDAQGLSPADVEAFAKWMDERTSVAAQTASLAVGSPSHWR
jgi:tetratricopeptide (TPR) repeat protein